MATFDAEVFRIEFKADRERTKPGVYWTCDVIFAYVLRHHRADLEELLKRERMEEDIPVDEFGVGSAWLFQAGFRLAIEFWMDVTAVVIYRE